MKFFEFTDRNFVAHFATQTRRADISPKELSENHKYLGRFLAENISDFLEMEEIDINHPQGIKKGKSIKESNVIILCFMRAGLYVAEGIREVLHNASLVTVKPIKGAGLNKNDLSQLPPDLYNRHIIIADSVVNTGKSLFPVLEQLENCGVKSIHVASLVMPLKTAQHIKSTYKESEKICFHIARISENSYVGKGKTDTGNRLFGKFYE